ncbi:hypothetical protein GCM10010103_77700 [Streptomyces paradoxus]
MRGLSHSIGRARATGHRPSAAVAADAACTSSVGTYVLRPSGSSNAAKKGTLDKYMDWAPKESGSSFLDTEFTAQYRPPANCSPRRTA